MSRLEGDAEKNIIDYLFEEGEWVNICKDSAKETSSVYPVASAREMKEGKYFCINPLFAHSSRKQLNLESRRNILIEFDRLTIRQQWQVIEDKKIPYRTVVHSGNKSLHVIISLDRNVERGYYRTIMRRLKVVLPQADAACFEPARLSRFATAAQPLLETGDRISAETLEEWLTEMGCSAKQWKHKAKKTLEYSKNNQGMLNYTTMQLLAGNISKEESHRATISAAKNLQEVGFTREGTIEALAKTRRHCLPDEIWEDSLEKAGRIVDWVWNEWANNNERN